MSEEPKHARQQRKSRPGAAGLGASAGTTAGRGEPTGDSTAAATPVVDGTGVPASAGAIVPVSASKANGANSPKPAHRGRLSGFIGVALVCAAAVFAVLAFWNYQQEAHAADVYTDLRTSVEESSDDASDSADGAATSADAASTASPIDFASLAQLCPDAYAWIRIPNTTIDYPIVQYGGDDQNYYLTHSAENQSNRAGAIFTQSYNAKDFSDPVTVVYGHNWAGTSVMFTPLHQYEDRSYFDQHRDLYIYTPSGTLTYRVFAAYKTDDSHILLTHDFSDSAVFQAYLQQVESMRSMSTNVADDVTLDGTSRILVLSTCNDDHQGRFVIHAVRVS